MGEEDDNNGGGGARYGRGRSGAGYGQKRQECGGDEDRGGQRSAICGAFFGDSDRGQDSGERDVREWEMRGRRDRLDKVGNESKCECRDVLFAAIVLLRNDKLLRLF